MGITLVNSSTGAKLLAIDASPSRIRAKGHFRPGQVYIWLSVILEGQLAHHIFTYCVKDN